MGACGIMFSNCIAGMENRIIKTITERIVMDNITTVFLMNKLWLQENTIEHVLVLLQSKGDNLTTLVVREDRMPIRGRNITYQTKIGALFNFIQNKKSLRNIAIDLSSLGLDINRDYLINSWPISSYLNFEHITSLRLHNSVRHQSLLVDFFLFLEGFTMLEHLSFSVRLEVDESDHIYMVELHSKLSAFIVKSKKLRSLQLGWVQPYSPDVDGIKAAIEQSKTLEHLSLRFPALDNEDIQSVENYLPILPGSVKSFVWKKMDINDWVLVGHFLQMNTESTLERLHLKMDNRQVPNQRAQFSRRFFEAATRLRYLCLDGIGQKEVLCDLADMIGCNKSIERLELRDYRCEPHISMDWLNQVAQCPTLGTIIMYLNPDCLNSINDNFTIIIPDGCPFSLWSTKKNQGRYKPIKCVIIRDV
ncbi:hypothetical protein SAMD00019534_029500 [Acytostelium subglobosum LB1]|uniref:hypothetical protein n=1 Tax=Acytostelium subglobosum LB1 TaxID=1410327 RepID=UPI000644B122|nr:hypothetical protein SAMD00019534_029500 [Acytostelium subglobosum LB1]GAM19775.1 hypothetical protein SAMD00019534_029500 [Acytostelium subglobosum LB1]|eukprot:XP_012756537.1 hypothetical protein SAMD00019534_029500 [Acytostelium subglobosum LB1]